MFLFFQAGGQGPVIFTFRNRRGQHVSPDLSVENAHHWDTPANTIFLRFPV